MRVKGVILENHRTAALAGFKVIYNSLIDRDFTPANIFQACDHSKKRGFSAAGWSKYHNKFPGCDLEIDAVYNRKFAVALSYTTKRNWCHYCSLSLFVM
ncbi:hypothetical protein At1D132_49650 (plasmid) [Agrobacterium fabrum]|nr:hypothetical protein At1D132_49650 [Agrobacterium fabrum]